MRKIVAVLVVVSLAFTGIASAAETSPYKVDMDIKVLYNARQLPLDVEPQNINGTVFVPFRAVANALGAQLSVSSDNKVVTFMRGDKTVSLTIGSKSAVANGKKVTLLAAPFITAGRTMVPTRFIAEQLGETVEWDSITHFVWIGHKNVPTLEEATEKEDLAPYLKYYTGIHASASLRNYTKGEPYTTVRIIKETDFPLIISGDIFYRIDLSTNKSKQQLFRAVTTDKGSMGFSLYLLQSNNPLKIRQPVGVEPVGDIRIRYNMVATVADLDRYGDKDWRNLSLSSIEYIGVALPSDSVILIENYFIK